MALETHYGNFTKSVAAAPVDQAVTGVGFIPKALIMWATPQTATGFTTDYNYGIGFSDGSTDYATAFRSDDLSGVAASICIGRHASKVLTLFRTIPLAECDLKSFDADGFTVTWTTNDANAYIIHYLAIGGDDLTNANVGYFVCDTAGGGTQSIAGVGFEPDALLAISAAIVTNPPGTRTHVHSSIGAATASRGGLVRSFSDHAVFTTDTSRLAPVAGAGVDFIGWIGPVTDLGRASLFSTGSDGFTLAWSSYPGLAFRVGYLALKGGQYHVGGDTQKTSTGTDAYTGAGFAPKGMLAFSWNTPTPNTIKVHNRVSIGAASAAGTEGSIWAGDTDGVGLVAGTQCDMATKTTKALMMVDTTTPAAVDAEADLSSFDADGFTVTWTTADAVARQFSFLLMGDSPPPAVAFVPQVMIF